MAGTVEETSRRRREEEGFLLFFLNVCGLAILNEATLHIIGLMSRVYSSSF